MNTAERIIVALDVPTANEAIDVIKSIPDAKWFKIGLELISSQEAAAVLEYCNRHAGSVSLFWDNKLCDIPNTVGKTVNAVAAKGVNMINVHALSGITAMEAAVGNKQNAIILAVTILTSLDCHDLERLGIEFSGEYSDKDHVERLVVQLAKAAVAAGVNGIVCSPQDIAAIKREGISSLLFVTPGVRPTWAAAGDQKRILTPKDAILAGADYLVIGRPITNPPTGYTRASAFKAIVDEIDSQR